MDVTYSHKVVLQSSHWLGCFWGIAASRPGAVAAMKKADRKCLTKVYRMHPHPSIYLSIYVGGPRAGVSEANLAMVLVLRSEELGRSDCMCAQATHGGVQDNPSPGP